MLSEIIKNLKTDINRGETNNHTIKFGITLINNQKNPADAKKDAILIYKLYKFIYSKYSLWPA